MVGGSHASHASRSASMGSELLPMRHCRRERPQLVNRSENSADWRAIVQLSAPYDNRWPLGAPTVRLRRPIGPLLGFSEAADAPLVLGDRVVELLRTEVGPERVREQQLGVGALPEQEVRDSFLAGRPDDQVGI